MFNKTPWPTSSAAPTFGTQSVPGSAPSTAPAGNVSPGFATGNMQPGASAGSFFPGGGTTGSMTPGGINPGTASPGGLTPGSLFPGSMAPGSMPGSMPGSLPGAMFPGSMAPGSTMPGAPTGGMIPMGQTGAIIPTSVTPGVGTFQQVPREESYVENILRMNLGKVGTFYMTYENNSEWNAKIFKGVIEAAGRDHIIISDPVTGKRFLLLMLNLDYITFDEPLNYTLPFGSGGTRAR